MTAPVQGHLNFPGDVRDSLAVGRAMGPTTYGGLMYVVGFEYDETANRTRVALSAVNPKKGDDK